MAKELSPLAALRQYMQAGKNGRKVTMNELKAIPPDERHEMGKLALIAIKEGWD